MFFVSVSDENVDKMPPVVHSIVITLSLHCYSIFVFFVLVFDEKVDKVPTVTVTEDQMSKTQRAEKVEAIQTAQVRQNTEQKALVTNPEPVVTQSETNHKPSTTQGGSSTQPETVQKKQMVESDVSSIQVRMHYIAQQ